MKRFVSLICVAVMMLCAAMPCMAADGSEKALAEAEVGDTVSFGSYVQEEGKEAEAISWIVLDESVDALLLLSEYCLDCCPFYDGYRELSWKESTLREWLNSDFIDTAFTEEEQELILEKNQRNKRNPYYSGVNFKDTRDRVFALSVYEVSEYLGEDVPGAEPTAYALAKAQEHGTADIGWWWLRNTGMNRYYFTGVPATGGIFYGGYAEGHHAYVRPAIWVTTE